MTVVQAALKTSMKQVISLGLTGERTWFFVTLVQWECDRSEGQTKGHKE